MSDKSQQTLVLNRHWQPIYRIDPVQAAILVLLGKAIVYKSFEDREIRSPSWSIPAPRIISLKDCKYYQPKRQGWSRTAIFKRDNYQCVQCGERQRHLLTLEHIIPRARWEKVSYDRGLPYNLDSFENCVTLCVRCNNYKGHRLPEEVGWNLVGRNPQAEEYSAFYRELADDLYGTSG
jgi:5-methylcytosine-specific restriction endonuclease McrA